MRKLFSALSVVTLLALAVTASGQTQTPAPAGQPPAIKGVKEPGEKPAPAGNLPVEVGGDDVVRVDTSLVTVPLSVLDAEGRYVTDLHEGDFKIFEDGREQRLAFFSEVTRPTLVVLLIDVSTSVIPHLNAIKESAIAFTDQMRETDYIYPVIFSGKLVPLLPRATNDRAALREAIRSARVINDNATSIYDAVQSVSDRILKHVRGRRALVLFTDGEDVTSRTATRESTLSDAQELGAPIYTVQFPREIPYTPGVFDDNIDPNPMLKVLRYSDVARRNKEYLRRLAENTGGIYFIGDKPEKIRDAFASIAEELRRQYVVGYYPDRSRGGGVRRVRVTVARPGLKAQTRKTFVKID